MRILFVDLLSPKGHRKTNNKFIQYLCKLDNDVSLDLVFRQGYIDYIEIDSIKKVIYFPEKYYKKTNKIKSRISNINLLRFMYRELDVNAYDIIFISSYETISISLFYMFRKIKNKVCIFNHNNISEILKSKIKKLFFKLINKDIIHLVYDKSIMEFLKKEVGINNRINVVHHPLFKINIENIEPLALNIIFSPSNSNTDTEIINILDILDKNESQIPIYIKSRALEYSHNNVKVSPKWLSDSEYEELFSKSKAILLIFDNDFKYRVSGVFFEAIAQNKYIITNSKYLYDTYIHENKDIGCYYKDSKELMHILEQVADITISEYQFDGIKNEHSDEYILNQLKDIIF